MDCFLICDEDVGKKMLVWPVSVYVTRMSVRRCEYGLLPYM
jgi:hypothetical protein